MEALSITGNSVQSAGTSTQQPANSLAAYTTAELKKLYYFSVAVQQLSILWAFSLLCTLAMALPVSWALTTPPQPSSFYTYFLASLFLGTVTICGFKRTNMGWVTGIVLCLMLVAVFPIGTVIGVTGLFIYIRAGKLFGPQAPSHRVLKEAYLEHQAKDAPLQDAVRK